MHDKWHVSLSPFQVVCFQLLKNIKKDLLKSKLTREFQAEKCNVLFQCTFALTQSFIVLLLRPKRIMDRNASK